MESFFLGKLTHKLNEVAAQSGVDWCDAGWLTPSGKIWFALQERQIPPIYHEIIRDKKERLFKTEEGRDGLGIPIIVTKSGAGLVVCAGPKKTITATATRKLLKELAVLSELFIHNQRIKNISQERWGEPIVFIGFNSVLMERKQHLRLFARADRPVLITGETGVGKEVFARLCHLWSPREDKAFYSVNCGQFQNENLMVSELFGHKKGSFTGAVEDHKGVFEMASSGTVFLDEVGELSLEAQKMLLRVLDKQEIKPLGAKNIQKVDVRVVSATHRNLLAMVERGAFREDLYYRLSAFVVELPPLRERGEDCELLLDYYLNELNKAHGIRKQFSADAFQFLRAYNYPGNIRELKSVVETGFWMSVTDVIDIGDVMPKVQERQRKTEASPEPTLRDALAILTRYLDQQNKMFEHLTANSSVYGNLPGSHARKEKQSAADPVGATQIEELYRRMTEEGASYWDVVKIPFMNRDLSRDDVKALIQLGLKACDGSYTKLGAYFNVLPEDQKRFYDHLRQYNLQPITRKN